jgi:hypothetical protein
MNATKTLKDLLVENLEDHAIYEAESGTVLEDSPEDYTVLCEHDCGDETFAIVEHVGAVGFVVVDMTDGCRLNFDEVQDGKLSSLLVWLKTAYPSLVTVQYRMVGFTDSTYENGEPEVGYKGELCDSIREAQEVGCGDNGLATGCEIREYIDDHYVADHAAE